MHQGSAFAPVGPGALLLLFRADQRPDRRAIESAIAGADRLSIVHAVDGEGAGGAPIIELLRDGMTYDLVGLAPGPPATVPPLPHRLGADKTIVVGRKGALALQAGPHLAAGANCLPVVRSQMGVAMALVPWLPALRAIGWPPAGTLVGPDYFVSSIAAWLGGGAFPALGLTAFAPDEDGGMRTQGLAFFTGQELRIAPALAQDRAGAVRLGVRLVNQLVGQGVVSSAEPIVGPEGQPLLLVPDPSGTIVEVQRG